LTRQRVFPKLIYKTKEMIYIILSFVITLISVLALTHKQIIWMIAEKRAMPKIEKALFAQDGQNKEKVLQDIHRLTNNRLSDEMAIDYFYKIKGLQVLSVNQPLSYWVKAYFTTPTKVKLNYFEQVKFYETFLNYPSLKKSTNPSIANRVDELVKVPLLHKLIPQKMA